MTAWSSKISPETVRQILRNHRLKPWRQKMWLSAKVPRDAAFAARVMEICDLYTRPLAGDEMVLCVDEMTSLQPPAAKVADLGSQAESADPGRTRIRPVRSIESVRGFRYAERQGLRANR